MVPTAGLQTLLRFCILPVAPQYLADQDKTAPVVLLEASAALSRRFFSDQGVLLIYSNYSSENQHHIAYELRGLFCEKAHLLGNFVEREAHEEKQLLVCFWHQKRRQCSTVYGNSR